MDAIGGGLQKIRTLRRFGGMRRRDVSARVE